MAEKNTHRVRTYCLLMEEKTFDFADSALINFFQSRHDLIYKCVRRINRLLIFNGRNYIGILFHNIPYLSVTNLYTTFPAK
jgi:hypothetical protein